MRMDMSSSIRVRDHVSILFTKNWEITAMRIQEDAL